MNLKPLNYHTLQQSAASGVPSVYISWSGNVTLSKTLALELKIEERQGIEFDLDESDQNLYLRLSNTPESYTLYHSGKTGPLRFSQKLLTKTLWEKLGLPNNKTGVRFLVDIKNPVVQDKTYYPLLSDLIGTEKGGGVK